jgi:uncharacterized protein YecT (DUF1311 family)
MRNFILPVIVLLTASLALAQPGDHTKKSKANLHTACSGQTQTEMNLCGAQEYAKADAHLNAIYRKIRDQMKSDLAEAERLKNEEDQQSLRTSTDKLTSAERAWIQYRDLICGLAADAYEGGSIQQLIHSDCLREATEHHIQELKSAFEVGDRKLE